MEWWQKECITTHLVELMENTILNAKLEAVLQAGKVLSKVDLDKLESSGKTDGKLAAVKLLYDILTTRTNTFKAIGKATFTTGQSGAFLILLKGLVTHILQLNHIVLEEEALNDILKEECDKEETLKFFMNKTDNPSLFEGHWIPSAREGIYISRYISNRVKLDPAVFRQTCLDIFVITGITRLQLSELAHPSSTTTSRDVILRRNATSRFVLLEHAQDWSKIKATLSKQRPVHWIRFEEISKEYILQESTGSNEFISKHVPVHLRDKSLYVSEEQFRSQIDDFANKRAFCICDTPGMGKTWLLESMIRETHHRSPKRLMAFASLSEFVKSVSSKSGYGAINELDLLRYLSPFSLTSSILSEIMRQEKTDLEIFLDGFDEVPREHVESTKRFFRNMTTTWKKVKLLVTSRPHMRRELEQTLGAVAYDILPFSEENQVDYLVAFWKAANEEPEELNEEKLRTFALACLRKLKESLSKEECNFMGIPLQCRLLAWVNLDNALLYCRYDTSNIDDFISPTSMNDMYRKYLERGMKKARLLQNFETSEVLSHSKRPKLSHDYSAQPQDNTGNEKMLKAYHVWKALQLLFPDLAEDYFQEQNLPERSPTAQVLACGILQVSAGDELNTDGVTFLHRTFAEYFVAELFAEVVAGDVTFKNDDASKKFMKAFVTDILGADLDDFSKTFYSKYSRINFDEFKFKNPELVNFLDANLSRLTLDFISEDVALSVLNFMEKDTLCPILSSSIRCRYVGVGRFIKLVLCRVDEGSSTGKKDRIRKLISYSEYVAIEQHYRDTYSHDDHFWTCITYLALAMEYANMAMVEELYSLFRECLEENLHDICPRFPAERKSLILFLRRCDYSLIEFFADRIPFSFHLHLKDTIEKTLDHSFEDVTTLIDCLKQLKLKGQSILPEKYGETITKTLFSRRVHIEIIKFLVQERAELKEIFSDGENLLRHHFQFLGAEDFCELCRFLVDDAEAFDLFPPKLSHWEDTLPKIMRKINGVTLHKILGVPGVKLEGRDEKGNNLILAGISNGGHLETVQVLIQHGVDLHQKNDGGRGALHVAAANGNVDLVQFLLSSGESLEDQDEDGNTPILLASEHGHLAMVKHLMSQNAHIFAINKTGDNIVHKAVSSDIFTEENAKLLHYLLSLNEVHILFKKRNGSTQNIPTGETPVNIIICKKYYEKLGAIECLVRLPAFVLEKHEKNDLFLWAIKSCQNVEMLKLLIQKGANAFAINDKKQSSLHLAAEAGSLEVVQYLLSLGLPLEQRDENGSTPLLSSCANVKIAQSLILQGADAFAVDNGGNNIAHNIGGIFSLSAGEFKQEDYQNFFSTKNKAGRTPLHAWIFRRVPLDSETIKQIINTTCLDVHAVDEKGATMFWTAVANNFKVEVIRCLLRHVASEKVLRENMLDHQDNEGNTVLHLAAGNCEWAAMEFLISEGANVLLKNHAGENIAHTTIRQLCNLKRGSKMTLLNLIELPDGPELFKTTNNKGQSPLHLWISEYDHFSFVIGEDLDRNDFEMLLRKSGVDVNKTDHEGNTMLLSAPEESPDLLIKCLLKFGAKREDINK